LLPRLSDEARQEPSTRFHCRKNKKQRRRRRRSKEEEEEEEEEDDDDDDDDEGKLAIAIVVDL
jgi:hypothetical protein